MLAEPCTPDICDNSKNTVLGCQGRLEAEKIDQGHFLSG